MNTISDELNQCQTRRARLDQDFKLTSPIKDLLLAGLLVVTALSLVAAPTKSPVPADKAGHSISATLANLRPVPFTDVKIADAFWLPRQETSRVASLLVNLENLEKSGNLEALRLAGQRATNRARGPVYRDSDVYKALEAASYSLAIDPDPMLDRRLDEIIATLATAQQPDGYLNSYFTIKERTKRWTNLRDKHELYCAGHLIERAVAHYQATGKRSYLAGATKLADHMDSEFGPAPKRLGYPGHPEIELALVKLYRAVQRSMPHKAETGRALESNKPFA